MIPADGQLPFYAQDGALVLAHRRLVVSSGDAGEAWETSNSCIRGLWARSANGCLMSTVGSASDAQRAPVEEAMVQRPRARGILEVFGSLLAHHRRQACRARSSLRRASTWGARLAF
jgi:hypothetical protein